MGVFFVFLYCLFVGFSFFFFFFFIQSVISHSILALCSHIHLWMSRMKSLNKAKVGNIHYSPLVQLYYKRAINLISCDLPLINSCYLFTITFFMCQEMGSKKTWSVISPNIKIKVSLQFHNSSFWLLLKILQLFSSLWRTFLSSTNYQRRENVAFQGDSPVLSAPLDTVCYVLETCKENVVLRIWNLLRNAFIYNYRKRSTQVMEIQCKIYFSLSIQAITNLFHEKF